MRDIRVQACERDTRKKCVCHMQDVCELACLVKGVPTRLYVLLSWPLPCCC